MFNAAETYKMRQANISAQIVALANAQKVHAELAAKNPTPSGMNFCALMCDIFNENYSQLRVRHA